jgi:hypothetical protein
MTAVQARRRICCVVSVDVDRFSDAKLRREWLPIFAQLGAVSVADIRRLCAEYRAGGFEAFPSCENHDARGYCTGHPIEPCRPHCEHPHRCVVHEFALLGPDGRCGAS